MAVPAVLGMLGSAANAVSIGGSTVKILKSMLPTLAQEADVVVTGMPHAKKKDLYWLAVSTAFSFINNFTLLGLTLPKGYIMLEYNAELNHVRFYCKQISTWDQVWYNLKRADPFGRLTTEIFGGPREETKGGAWQWYSRAIAGLPNDPADFGRLGWENETILTKKSTYTAVDGSSYVSYNPYPDGADESRGPNYITGDPAILALEPGYSYRYPEFLLLQALSPPCNPAVASPIPADRGLPAGLVGDSPGTEPPANVGPAEFGGGGDF
jgi:hypothetical protein